MQIIHTLSLSLSLSFLLSLSHTHTLSLSLTLSLCFFLLSNSLVCELIRYDGQCGYSGRPPVLPLYLKLHLYVYCVLYTANFLLNFSHLFKNSHIFQTFSKTILQLNILQILYLLSHLDTHPTTILDTLLNNPTKLTYLC